MPCRPSPRLNPQIPSHTPAKRRARGRLNLSLASGVAAANGCGFYVAPLLIEDAPALAAGGLVVFALAAPVQWGLVHEAIHGLLTASRRLDRLIGRMLGALLLYTFDVVRFGHLMHHSMTGHDFDRPDKAPPGRPRGRLWIFVRHYGPHLLGGQYALASLSAFGFLLPWRARAASHPEGLPRRRAGRAAGAGSGDALVRECRPACRDPLRRGRRRRGAGAVAGALWVGLAMAGGCPVLGRALLLSRMDSMPHYGLSGREIVDIPLFRIRRGLSLLVMNHHLHRLHHLSPNRPWFELPGEFGPDRCPLRCRIRRRPPAGASSAARNGPELANRLASFGCRPRRSQLDRFVR